MVTPMATLNPRQFQFSHTDVIGAVPGYNPEHVEFGILRSVQQQDIYTRKLIPILSVNSTGYYGWARNAAEDTIIGDTANRVHQYKNEMNEGHAVNFPPVVVSPAGQGRYDILDGMHRLQAAHQAGITHTAAYIRDRYVEETAKEYRTRKE